MLFIENNVIYYSRGDDEVLPVTQNGNNDMPYEVGELDTLVLTVRELPATESSKIVMQAMSTPGSNRIIIHGEDTKDVAVGVYSASIRYISSTGQNTTIWGKPKAKKRHIIVNYENFVMMPEVHNE